MATVVMHGCKKKRQLSAHETDALDTRAEVTARLVVVGGGWRRGSLLLALLIVPGEEARKEEEEEEGK